MQASSEPTTSAEVVARYKAARQHIDQAGVAYASGHSTDAPEVRHMANAVPLAPGAKPIVAIGSPINPALTFQSLIVGRSNRLACAAARQASDMPNQFNPLVLHGGSGYGKSHLLNAIANEQPEHSVYMTADWFANNAQLAKDVCRRDICQVVLIDDIQNIRSKTAQTDLLSVMTSLLNTGRQLVVTADWPPCDIDNFEPRLRSRLAGGLIVEVGCHDRDLRFAILEARFVAARHTLPSFIIPFGCVAYMADEIKSGGRDLNGVFNRLLAKASIEGFEIDIDLVAATVSELIKPQEPRRILIEDIQRAVARDYNVSCTDLRSARRTANIVRPRQFAMYLAKKLTLRSLPEIGRKFGGRDHTTVLHAVRKMEALIAKDPALAEEERHFKSLLMEDAR